MHQEFPIIQRLLISACWMLWFRSNAKLGQSKPLRAGSCAVGHVPAILWALPYLVTPKIFQAYPVLLPLAQIQFFLQEDKCNLETKTWPISRVVRCTAPWSVGGHSQEMHRPHEPFIRLGRHSILDACSLPASAEASPRGCPQEIQHWAEACLYFKGGGNRKATQLVSHVKMRTKVHSP